MEPLPVHRLGNTLRLGRNIFVTPESTRAHPEVVLEAFLPDSAPSMVVIPVRFAATGGKMVCRDHCQGCNDTDMLCGSIPPPPRLTPPGTAIVPDSMWPPANGAIRLFDNVDQAMTALVASVARPRLHYVFQIGGDGALFSRAAGAWTRAGDRAIARRVLTIAVTGRRAR